MGLAIDSSGDLFVANVDGSSVTEYAPGASGNAAPKATISGASTGLSNPHGLGFDSSGRLFVANAGTRSPSTPPAPAGTWPRRPRSRATTHRAELPGGPRLRQLRPPLRGQRARQLGHRVRPRRQRECGPDGHDLGRQHRAELPGGPGLDRPGDLFVANGKPSRSSVTEYAPGASGT